MVEGAAEGKLFCSTEIQLYKNTKNQDIQKSRNTKIQEKGHRELPKKESGKNMKMQKKSGWLWRQNGGSFSVLAACDQKD